jgi:DNA (cytosine-5)-methyltransferase 1
MKILNLYAGIGGNRKLWTDCDVTAVEYDPEIAKIYQRNYPLDTVIVGDAHQFLLDHYSEYGFIWASPPCPTHSRLRTMQDKVVYPDITLYQEIVLLSVWFNGLFCVENVIPYYKPLIAATSILHRHLFWCNFSIPYTEFEKYETCKKLGEREFLEKKLGFNVDGFAVDKRKVLRNCVLPELGLHIFNAMKSASCANALGKKNDIKDSLQTAYNSASMQNAQYELAL